jgi:hypothetical protein
MIALTARLPQIAKVVAQNLATDAAATRGAVSSPFAVTALSVQCEK